MRGKGPLDGEAVGELLDLTFRSWWYAGRGGPDQADWPGHVPEPKLQENKTCGRWGTRFLYSNRLRFAYGDSGD